MAGTSKDVMKLRIGTAITPAPALPESTLRLARDPGFYQKVGLDVEIVETNATPSVITAMRTGDVDVGSINYQDVIQLTASKDLEMRAINSSNGRNFFMIVGKSSIGSVLELSGKSFAVSRLGGQDHALSIKVMAAKGLNADSVSYVSVGAPNIRAQASVANQIDATTLSLATWVQNEKELKAATRHCAHRPGIPVGPVRRIVGGQWPAEYGRLSNQHRLPV